MPLTNAEIQKRYRERLKAKAALADTMPDVHELEQANKDLMEELQRARATIEAQARTIERLIERNRQWARECDVLAAELKSVREVREMFS